MGYNPDRPTPDEFNLSNLDEFKKAVGALLGKPADEVDTVVFRTECEHAAIAHWVKHGLLYGLTPEQMVSAMRAYRGDAAPAPAPVAKPRPKAQPKPAAEPEPV